LTLWRLYVFQPTQFQITCFHYVTINETPVIN